MQALGVLEASKHLLAILLISTELVHTWRPYNLEINSYRYEIWDHRIVNFCNFTLLKEKQRNVISGSLSFGINITELICEATLTMRRPNEAPMTLINRTLSTCEFFQRDTGNVMRIILQQFQKGTVYKLKDCQVPANQLITVDNFYIEPNLLPAFMPDFEFTAQFNFLMDKKYVFKVFSNGSIISKKQNKLSKSAKKH